jgi:hypothetical protein
MSEGIEGIINATKFNIEKYGFFFWLILFGFIEIIVSIIHNEEYILMGLLFCAYGLLGYALSELMDRISYSCFAKENKEQGEKKIWVVKTPLWFHILNVAIKLAIFVGLLWTINWKYKLL